MRACVLLHACSAASEHHERCRRWLELALNGPEQVGRPWQTVLALEQGATLCTTDRDFARFRGLKLLNPLEPH